MTGAPSGMKVSVKASKRHTHPYSGGIVWVGDVYEIDMNAALDMVSRGIVRVIDETPEEIAEPVRVVETKEGAAVETPAPALSVSKDAAPKRRGPKAKVR